MCGITGVFGTRRLENPKFIIEKMNNALAHRGPNADGVFIDDDIALGHKRLSIIDLSPGANQPMLSANQNFVLAFNGEIYNYKEVKAQLNDYSFVTNSDTEVVLAAFQKWGEACVHQFNGMFAFAVWDKTKKQLTICRDRLGIKPLYYYLDEEKLVFASEIRSVLKSELVPKKLNNKALFDYFSYQTVHAPETIVNGVKMLMPGHTLKISEAEFEIKPFWQLTTHFSKKAQQQSREEIKAEVKSLLLNSVEKRLVSDVPFGAFLSGGIDSSALVGLISGELGKKIDTFSVSFNEEEFSEAKYAKIVADKFKTNHHNIKLTPQNFLDELPQAIKSIDHPSGDGPNTYIVSGATKKAGITMALSGLGGDELFAGYEVFKRQASLEEKRGWMMSFPPFIRKMGATGIKWKKNSVQGDKMAEMLSLSNWDFHNTYSLSRKVILKKDLSSILNTAYTVDSVATSVNNLVGEGTQGLRLPLLSKVSVAEITTYMQNVLLRDSDQMSMVHALELRVPFLDHNLVEYALGIPNTEKYPNSPKQLLVESLGDLLPPEIVNRPKMGFVLPWEQWMKKDLKLFCDEQIESLSAREWINESGLKSYYNKFQKGSKKVTWSRIWPLIVLENWLKENEIE